MKDIKCPVCGKKLKKCQSDTQGICYFCDTCLYNIHGRPGSYWGRGYKTIEEAYHAAEAFVSKFPPIMRVHKGDIIEYEETCDGDILNGRVTKRIFDTSAFLIEVVLIDDDGNDCLDLNAEPEIDTIYSFQVRKWPWELNQTEEKS